MNRIATFQPFDMERMMSKWENIVTYYLRAALDRIHELIVELQG